MSEIEPTYSSFWSSIVQDNYRDFEARDVFPSWTKEITLGRFFGFFESTQNELDDFKDKLSSDNIIEYLNSLSEAIGKKQNIDDQIVFLRTESKAPAWHRGFKCRPAFVAVKMPPEVEHPTSVTLEKEPTYHHPSKKEGKLTWSQLEATAEIYMGGSSYTNAMNRGASYTGDLLKARPDLVSVTGIIFHAELAHFRIYLTDAWGVRRTETIAFDSEYTVSVLGDWIHRLYHPERRFDIERVGSFPYEPTFIVDVESHGRFRNCVLLHVGSPFHRRSAIYTTPDNLVIKSQYVEKNNEFKEIGALCRIHESGGFPGIVRLAPVSTTKQGAVPAEVNETKPAKGEATFDIRIPESLETVGQPQNRHPKGVKETLLVLEDKGRPLVEAETVLEALIAFYDLLEVTRFLFKRRKIFYRDISEGNVLLREKDWVSKIPFCNEFGDMCFATHLLGEKGPNAEASRLHTRVLLIDFDMVEDRGGENSEPSTERTGTPMFMARLVRHPWVGKGQYVQEEVPQFQTEFALERYKACAGGRIEEFPKGDRPEEDWSWYRIKERKEIQYSHRLSYEAESILWLLLSWSIQVQPLAEGPKELVPEYLWWGLVGEGKSRDPRERFVTSFPSEVCHPVYRGLDELLVSLFEQLKGYQEEIVRPLDEQDPIRMKDEYLHEVCQRIILDFIVKMVGEPFMREKINPTRRPKEHVMLRSQPMSSSPVFTNGEKRDRETMGGTGTQSSGSPAAKKIKTST